MYFIVKRYDDEEGIRWEIVENLPIEDPSKHVWDKPYDMMIGGVAYLTEKRNAEEAFSTAYARIMKTDDKDTQICVEMRGLLEQLSNDTVSEFYKKELLATLNNFDVFRKKAKK